jgi:hypothetical protein
VIELIFCHVISTCAQIQTARPVLEES